MTFRIKYDNMDFGSGEQDFLLSGIWKEKNAVLARLPVRRPGKMINNCSKIYYCADVAQR